MSAIANLRFARMRFGRTAKSGSNIRVIACCTVIGLSVINPAKSARCETPAREASAKIAEDSRIHINDDVVEIKARANNARAILEDLYGPQRVGTKDAFRKAIDDTVAGLSPLRIVVD